MDFTSLNDLYKRLTPALNSKEMEFKNMGFDHLTKKEIWKYLSSCKWNKTKDLNLYQMVDDILNIDYIALDKFIKNEI